MALLDFVKKKKDQLVGAYNNDASTLGVAKNTVMGLKDAAKSMPSRALSVAQKIPKVEDTRFFKGTTDFMSNLNTRPLSSRADSTMGKLAGGIIETPYTFLTSVPKTAATGFKMAASGDMNTRQGLKKFGGMTLESGLDTASMGLFGKANALRKAGMSAIGSRVPAGTVTSLIKQGAKQGLKTGGAYGAGYGLSEGLKQNEDLKGIAKSTATGGATGALFGGVLGGGIPAASGLYKAVKHDLAVRRGQSFGKPESLPERTRWNDVATPREKEAGISLMERGRTLPAQTLDPNAPLLPMTLREIGTAMPRPGMSIKAVDDPLLQAEAKANFDAQWKKAYGNRPATVNEPTALQQRAMAGTPNIDAPIQPPLLQEAGKYKTTINLQDKDDVDYLRRIFSDDIVNEIKSGKTTNWRGENYSDIARVNFTSEVPQTVEQKLAGKIKDAKLNSDTFYHGTSSGSADSIMASGFKPGSKLPANAYRGGGYGKTQSTVSFAETPKEAGIFSTLTKDGKIVEAKLKPNARVVSIDGIEDAVDLEDYIGYLRKQKIDAVYIGGGEKELVVINPKAATPIKSQLTDLYNKAQGGEKALSFVDEAKLRGLPAPARQLALPAGPLPVMSSKSKAANFARKYGMAPEFKNKIGSSRPIYVGESGIASFSRNKASGADIAENLGNTEFKDIGTLGKGGLDIVRNFRRFFGARSQEFVDKYIAPFQQSKDTMYRNLEKESDTLDKVIVKGLGIERGSKESAAVQELGEGLRDEASLVKDFGEAKANNIIMANQWFRAQYDRMLGEVNKARSYVYPNQPDKQIQRRDDYYRHFRELQDGFQGLANIFETPAGIDNKLAGISNQTKPNSKWLSFAQKRLGVKTDVDAVGGFIDYLGAAEYAKNVDPKIHGFRQLAEQVAEQGNKEGKDYNNFVGFLERTADHLSGKTNSLDRGIQEFTGRKSFKVVDWLNRRVKANTILGNASSSLAQVFALPAGIASAGEKNFYKGTKRLVGSIGKDDAIMRQSPFLRERYFKALDKFDKGIFNNTKKLAVFMVTALDELSTKAIWNSHYEKAISEGIKNPIKYSDEITGNIVGRRGIGETPLLQQSKTFQMIAPFQLEVANAWPLMKELNDAGKMKTIKLLAYTYLLNRGVEAVRGSDVAFDPIQAAIEGYKQSQEEDTIGGKVRAVGGRMAGEVLSNVPLGQTVAGLYPEYGSKDVMGSGVDLPTREKLFGKGDPTRFGSGLLVAKGLQDFKYKVLPPFGGAQIKRTVDGLKSYSQGYKENSGGKVQYPIEKNLRNFIQGGVFGPSSIPEGRSYYKEEKTPLGEIQSEKFKLGGGKDYYDKVMNERASEKEKTSVKGKGVVEIAKASGSSDIKQLSNGKFYIQKLDKEFDTEKKATRAIALDDFMKSDNETLEYDGKYYTKDDSTDQGYTSKSMKEKKSSDQSKELSFMANKIESKYDQKDIAGYVKESEALYAKLGLMYQEETDEATKLDIENKMRDLAVKVNKYKSYGGFTKPKKGKKINIPSINDADFIVKKMSSKLRPLRAFGRSRTNLASVARPNIRRPKRLS